MKEVEQTINLFQTSFKLNYSEPKHTMMSGKIGKAIIICVI